MAHALQFWPLTPWGTQDSNTWIFELTGATGSNWAIVDRSGVTLDSSAAPTGVQMICNHFFIGNVHIGTWNGGTGLTTIRASLNDGLLLTITFTASSQIDSDAQVAWFMLYFGATRPRAFQPSPTGQPTWFRGYTMTNYFQPIYSPSS